MMFPIPTLGLPVALVSIDAHALLAALTCVGVSLALAWGVMRAQRLSIHTWRSNKTLPQLPLPSHA